MSVALTAFFLQAIRCPHPPAGATTLIVSLGLIARPPQLLTMALSVLLITVIAVALNLPHRSASGEDAGAPAEVTTSNVWRVHLRSR